MVHPNVIDLLILIRMAHPVDTDVLLLAKLDIVIVHSDHIGRNTIKLFQVRMQCSIFKTWLTDQIAPLFPSSGKNLVFVKVGASLSQPDPQAIVAGLATGLEAFFPLSRATIVGAISGADQGRAGYARFVVAQTFIRISYPSF